MKILNCTKLFFFVVALSTLFINCVEDGTEILENNNIILSGTNVVPQNQSAAVGSVSAKFDKATKILSYTILWDQLSTEHKGIKILNGSKTTNGNESKTVQATGSSSGSITESWNVPQELVSTLEAGGLYIQIYTTNFPSGEIRGQIEF